MKTLSYNQVVRMFIDSPHTHGFTEMFSGTFGGLLLHDHDAGKFFWLSEEEHEQFQAETAHPSIAIVRAILEPCTSIQQITSPCHEPDELANTG